MKATKDEERNALEKIRKIVEDLGEHNHIAIAFEGCFEMAEANIEFNYACSVMKAIEDGADEKMNLELENFLMKEKLEKAEQKAAQLEETALMPEELEDVRSIVRRALADDKEKMRKAAEEVIEYAESPDSSEFKGAVAQQRRWKSIVERERALYERIEELTDINRIRTSTDAMAL